MSFKDSLRNGNLGERIFLEHYGSKIAVEKVEGRESDFKFSESGETIELKTDFYDMDKTPNMFMERYSDIEKKSPGGPWQALEKGSKFFVYMYINDRVAYWYDTKKLVKLLNKLIVKREMKKIWNKSYSSGGYLIKRGELDKCKLFVDGAVTRKTL